MRIVTNFRWTKLVNYQVTHWPVTNALGALKSFVPLQIALAKHSISVEWFGANRVEERLIACCAVMALRAPHQVAKRRRLGVTHVREVESRRG